MSHKLSPHFTLSELTKTSTGLSNVPSSNVINHLRNICVLFLEPLRFYIGCRPIIINSGFRSIAVNKSVGGVERSLHLDGLAVDISNKSFSDSPFSFENFVDTYRQTGAIVEFIKHDTYIHLGFNSKFF